MNKLPSQVLFEQYLKLLRAVLDKTEGVEDYSVKVVESHKTVRVLYCGSALEPELYQSLQVDTSARRPRGVELAVYRKKRL